VVRWLVIAAAVLILDQATKVAADRWLGYHEPVAVIPFLNLTLSYNTGAAFSFLSDAGGWQRWFFIALALVVSAAVALWLSRLGPAERWTGLALSLVLGGALGNVLDRVIHGHVIDFIDFYVGDWHWPTFNIADSAISIGVAILSIDGLVGHGPVRRRP